MTQPSSKDPLEQEESEATSKKGKDNDGERNHCQGSGGDYKKTKFKKDTEIRDINCDLEKQEAEIPNVSSTRNANMDDSENVVNEFAEFPSLTKRATIMTKKSRHNLLRSLRECTADNTGIVHILQDKAYSAVSKLGKQRKNVLW